ncbi:MAG: hypothetical protein QOG04_1607 [Actinomycetota bacterium]|jgi:hypothetical protein|nr:hypothetical protein [Actinomycetota bacterium]
MIRKLVVLLVVVGALIAGDMWLKATAESRVAQAMQKTFDSPGTSKVELGGFPFVLKLISGTIPSAKVTSSSLERDGVMFTDVRMTLEDIEFSVSKIIAGELGSVKVRDGHGSAAIKGNDLVAALGAIGGLEVTLRDGKLLVRAGGKEVSADVTLKNTNLVVRAPGIGRSFEVALPRFVQGLQYRSVRLSGSTVVVEFSLENANFRQL